MSFKHVILLFALLSACGLSWADEFSDFRIPSHRVLGLSARADGGLRNSWYKPLDAHTSDFSGEASLGTELFALSESERFRLALSNVLDADGRFDVTKSREREYEGTPFTTYRQDRVTSQLWDVDADGRWYPWLMPLGLRADLNARGATAQYWHGDRQTYEDLYELRRYANDAEAWTYNYRVRAEIGFGWGKIRDVTGVAQSLISNDRLRRDRTISQDLSVATRQRLADLFYRRADYPHRHEFSEKYFWRDVEQILRDDPAFAGTSPDAYTLFRLVEPNHNGKLYRARGWFAGPLLRGAHSDDIYRAWSRYTSPDSRSEVSTRRTITYDDLLAGVMAEYYRPYGLKWQFNLSSTLLFPIRPDDHTGMDWSSHGELLYFITDRWLGAFSLDHDRLDRQERQFSGDGSFLTVTRNSWLVSSAVALEYHLEDHWNLRLSIYQSQYAVKYNPNDPNAYRYRAVQSTSSVTIGVVYHLTGIGLFSAPRMPREPLQPPFGYPMPD